MKQLFIDSTQEINENTVTISPETAHYLKSVLRLKANDTLTLIIGSHKKIKVKIETLSENTLHFEIVKTYKIEEKHPKLILIQALPKQDKMSDIIRKCTEAGIHSIYPVISERSIPKLNASTSQKKDSRWQKVAQEAAQQSRRNSRPQIHPIAPLNDILNTPEIHDCDLKIVAWECEETRTLKSHLSQQETGKSIALIIGPEGGLAENEIARLKQVGFTAVKLTDSILRVENAALYAQAQIDYHFESA